MGFARELRLGRLTRPRHTAQIREVSQYKEDAGLDVYLAQPRHELLNIEISNLLELREQLVDGTVTLA